jgi:uncharacterized membrane protein YciS (DUF1049 family)
MKNLIYIMLAVVGFIVAVGTVGAADQEVISFNRLVVQSLIAGALMGIAFFGLNLEEKREANSRRRKRGTRKKL